jgi:macrodomain Ter protein organizer (MatP/YcbG family)
MKATYKGQTVNVLVTKARDGELVTHFVELSDGSLARASGHEVEFECESLLEWVRSDAWANGSKE